MPTLGIDVVARIAQAVDAVETLSRKTQNSVRGMERSFSALNKVLGTVGLAFGAQQLASFVSTAVQGVAQLDRVSQETGFAAETLGVLKVAAYQADLSFEELTGGLVKFNKHVAEGGEVFQALGIDMANLKTPEAKLLALAKRFAELEAGENKTALAMAAFGRSGASMISFLNDLGEGLDKAAERAKRLGFDFSKEGVDAAKRYEESLKDLKLAGEALAITLGNDVIPKVVLFIGELLKGREIFGSFAAAMLHIGVSIDPFNTLTENLTEAREELDKLNKDLAQTKASLGSVDDTPSSDAGLPGRTRAQLERRRAIVLGQIEFLKFKQQQDALAQSRDARGRELLDPRDFQARAQSSKEAAPSLRGEDLRGIETKARLQVRLAAAKQEAQQLEQIEDIHFARAEKAIRDHFDTRTRIAQNAYRVEIEALEDAIATQNQALKKATTEKDKAPINAELIKLRGERDRLIQSGKDVGILNAERATDAEKELEDRTIETNAALQEQEGFLVGSAQKLRETNKALRERQEIVQAIASGQLPKSAAVDLDRAREQADATKELTQALFAEDTARKRVDAELLIAESRRIESGNSYAAEKKFIDATIQAHVAYALILHKEAQALDDRAKKLGEGPERERLQAEAALKRAQAEQHSAVSSPAALAHQDFLDQLTQTDRLLERQAIAEEEINLKRESGFSTETEHLRALDQKRRESVAQLRKEYDVLKAKADLSKDPADAIAAERVRIALEQLAATSNQVALRTQLLFEDAFIDPFEDFVLGVKNADEALKSFFQNIASSMLRIASQELGKKLFRSLFANDTASGEKGLFSLFGIFGSLGGGGAASGGVGSSTGVVIESANGNIITPQGPLKLERFARGGIATRPMLSLVGEGSMNEAIIPLPDGRSVPVQVRGSGGTRVQAGPSAITKLQPVSAPAVTLQLHPSAMQMTLRDWFEGEMARQLATR
jgi:hypothetical protein